MAISAKQNVGDIVPDMNTTPLIDVMLVLLVMLIVTLPMQTHAIKMDLPIHPSKAPPPPVVTLSIDFDGTISWNGQAVDAAALDRNLVATSRQNPQPDVHVVASKLAKYDVVAKVLANAQRRGVTHIGLVGTQDYAN